MKKEEEVILEDDMTEEEWRKYMDYLFSSIKSRKDTTIEELAEEFISKLKESK